MSGDHLLTLERLVLTESQCVTYKSLSLQLDTTANAAKVLLAEFSRKFAKDISVVYIVGGERLVNGEAVHEIELVPAKDLEATKKSFQSIVTQHVYSVEPNRASAADGENSKEDGCWSARLFRNDLAASMKFYEESDIMRANPLRDNRHSSVTNQENITRVKPLVVAANEVYVPQPKKTVSMPVVTKPTSPKKAPAPAAASAAASTTKDTATKKPATSGAGFFTAKPALTKADSTPTPSKPSTATAASPTTPSTPAAAAAGAVSPAPPATTESSPLSSNGLALRSVSGVIAPPKPNSLSAMFSKQLAGGKTKEASIDTPVEKAKTGLDKFFGGGKAATPAKPAATAAASTTAASSSKEDDWEMIEKADAIADQAAAEKEKVKTKTDATPSESKKDSTPIVVDDEVEVTKATTSPAKKTTEAKKRSSDGKPKKEKPVSEKKKAAPAKKPKKKVIVDDDEEDATNYDDASDEEDADGKPKKKKSKKARTDEEMLQYPNPYALSSDDEGVNDEIDMEAADVDVEEVEMAGGDDEEEAAPAPMEDEDEEEMIVRKKKNKTATTESAKKSEPTVASPAKTIAKKEESDDEEDDLTKKKLGFFGKDRPVHLQTTSVQIKAQRKRREVEKTYVDDNGYLVTEKVWVEEELTPEEQAEVDRLAKAEEEAVAEMRRKKKQKEKDEQEAREKEAEAKRLKAKQEKDAKKLREKQAAAEAGAKVLESKLGKKRSIESDDEEGNDDDENESPKKKQKQSTGSDSENSDSDASDDSSDEEDEENEEGEKKEKKPKKKRSASGTKRPKLTPEEKAAAKEARAQARVAGKEAAKKLREEEREASKKKKEEEKEEAKRKKEEEKAEKARKEQEKLKPKVNMFSFFQKTPAAAAKPAEAPKPVE